MHDGYQIAMIMDDYVTVNDRFVTHVNNVHVCRYIPPLCCSEMFKLRLVPIEGDMQICCGVSPLEHSEHTCILRRIGADDIAELKYHFHCIAPLSPPTFTQTSVSGICPLCQVNRFVLHVNVYICMHMHIGDAHGVLIYAVFPYLLF